MDDIVKDFLIESHENLDRLDQELVQLESDPKSKGLLDSIFRTIHTIKGSCGFLGFAHLEKVAHRGENLLSKLREGQLTLTAEITNVLLAMVDAVRRMLAEIQATEKDGDNDYPELLERIKALQEAGANAVPGPAAPPTSVQQSPVAQPVSVATGEIRILEEPQPAPAEPDKATNVESPAPLLPVPESDAQTSTSQFRPTTGKIGGILVDRGCIDVEDLALALQEQERGDRRRLGEILVALGFCRPEDVAAAQQILEARGRNVGVETVRVGVDLLDTLVNLIGELVLARNQLLLAANAAPEGPLQAVSQRMSRIVTEVQEQVMKTRMQPIGSIWNKFPRTVRDLAQSCGKEVQLEMEGQDTELDRSIIEAIKDPLTHLVRNSIDHGIESPENRKKTGKEPTGRLDLRAFHESGRVNLEICDDGAGLNLERIRAKAMERGLITSQQARTMSEQEIFNLIFLPGFSTAEKVTNVSGRGVGMDVVKTNVEKINGTIDVQSAFGHGTTVRITLPLTLAIVPALLIRCRSERFAIPQVSVQELVGLDKESGAIEQVQGVPVYRLRGNLLPLVYLDRELGLTAGDAAGPEATPSIVVLQSGSTQFGLVVDDILDTEEIVVKPLSAHLKGLDSYSGATIMGDGRVALILDVMGLAQRARLVSKQKDPKAVVQSHAHGAVETRQPLLIARHGAEGRVAIPLNMVARLEGFPASRIKRIGQQEVMEYRGQIIPLVRLSQVLPAAAEDSSLSSDSMELVVYSERGRTVALIVDCIVDIVEGNAAIDSMAARPGVVGSFMDENCITEMLDLPGILQSAVPGLLEQPDAAGAGGWTNCPSPPFRHTEEAQTGF